MMNALSIGLATPFSWTGGGEVNDHVAQLAAYLTGRGHRVTIIAPSTDRAAVRRAAERVREVLMGERETLFDPGEPYPHSFFPGGTHPIRLISSAGVIAVSPQLMSDVDVLLQSEQLDVLHVHEPFPPGMGWTALEAAGCPLVATFHTDSERYRSYWLARPRLQRYFASFDAALAVSRAVRDSAARAFEGEFRVLPTPVDTERFAPRLERRPGPLRVLFVGSGRRHNGLRTLLRALDRLGDEGARLQLHVCGPAVQDPRSGVLVPPGLEERVHLHGVVSAERLTQLHREADVFCAPATEVEGFAMPVLRAMAAGSAVLASDIAGHRDLVSDGRDGVLVPPRQPRALARELRALLEDQGLRGRLATEARATAARYSWQTVGAELEEVYAQAVRHRRARTRADGARRPVELYADFHVHSDHSKDCAVPVADILARARELGIDIVAITDHNSLEGGLEGLRLADQYGVRVIAGEEVKTAEGEVIGLFLTSTIPGGLSFAETITAIKDQGGVVYVPHPFDRLHMVPSHALLRRHAGEIDVMEVFNARLAFPSFNERAELFAARYRIPAAAGSDAHVLPGLGTALTGMADFDGPRDFVAALADSRIVRRRKNVLYLTSLKFLQTNAPGQTQRR